MAQNTTDNEELARLAEELCEVSEKVDAAEAKLAAKKQPAASAAPTAAGQPETLTRAAVETLVSAAPPPLPPLPSLILSSSLSSSLPRRVRRS
jgi:hypothetical protein